MQPVIQCNAHSLKIGLTVYSIYSFNRQLLNHNAAGADGYMDDNAITVTSPLKPEEVYREHALYVKKMIAKLADKYSDVLTPEDMEDIEQDVWFRVMKSLDGFRGDCKLTSYIGAIVSHCVIDHFKSAKKHQSENYDDVEYELSPPHRMSPEERLDIELMLDSIIDTVHAMTDRRQMVFYLIGIKKYTQSMTAEKLRLTQSTVSEHWASIQQELKQAIKARFPESNCNLEELLWRIDI